MAGIYIHIPWCKTYCRYCDFHSSTSLRNKGTMLERMMGEMSQRKDFLHDRHIETIYFGGGTPSLCTPDELGTFIAKAAELWDTSTLKEITAEINPDDASLQYFEGLREQGINRFSIGIQSFSDDHLRWMNRRHDAPAGFRAIELAREAGLDNISIDLIYGLEPMTTDEWRYNLEKAVELRPEHISAYHLTIESGTPLGKDLAAGKAAEIVPEQSASQFETMREVLTEAGYEHYEISNFALPGRRSLHNSNYWSGQEYIGIGPSAHSYDGFRRCWSVSDNAAYIRLQPTGEHLSGETLSPEDRYNEFVMTSLRCYRGIDIRYLEKTFGPEKLNHFLKRSEKFIRTGHISRKGNIFFIPARHYILSDGIMSDFFSV